MATKYIRKVIDVEKKVVEDLEKSKADLDKEFSKYSDNLKKDHEKKVAGLESASKKELDDSSVKADKEISKLKVEHEAVIKGIEDKFSKNSKNLVSECVDIVLG